MFRVTRIASGGHQVRFVRASRTIITEGLEIVGSVTGEGLVEVDGGVDRVTKPAPTSHLATSGLPTRGDMQLAP